MRCFAKLSVTHRFFSHAGMAGFRNPAPGATCLEVGFSVEPRASERSDPSGFRTLGSFPKHPRSLPKLDRLKYTKCWHTMASSFLETALCSIMQTLFPSGTTFNINSVTCALQHAWKYLQHMDPCDEEQVMIQQDLRSVSSTLFLILASVRHCNYWFTDAGALRSDG